jgi:hypothetical protein
LFELDGGGNKFLVATNTSAGEVSEQVVTTNKVLTNYTITIPSPANPANPVSLTFLKLSESAQDGHIPVALTQQVAVLYAVFLPTSSQILPPSSFSRRIEFFGASDTAGFGVDSPTPTPSPEMCVAQWVANGNCNRAYSGVLARLLEAEMHLQAWTGKGLIKNADENVCFTPSCFRPIPAYINRTIATDWTAKTEWDFTKWVPDVIVLSVGGNDYNNPKQPTWLAFDHAYEQMLGSIFTYYASAPKLPVVVNICGGGSPSDPSRNRACPFVENATHMYKQAHAHEGKVVEYVEVPVGVVADEDRTCLGHHNRNGSAKVAHYLEPRIRKMMGWAK